MKLNKEFWEQVLLDYEDYTSDNASLISICGGSSLFREVWGSQKDEIRLLAKEFLDYYCITDVDLGVGLNLLFVNPLYSEEADIEIRKNFLNYAIENAKK